jgi:hypothetical protein
MTTFTETLSTASSLSRIPVSLSFEEGLAAGIQGLVQMMRAINRGTVGFDHGGQSARSMKERWAAAIQGQMAEHAFSKAMGFYPHASVAGIQGDDPGGVAIRSTPWPNGCLIVNKSELPKNDDKPFVLVCGHWPNFMVCGWVYGREAAREEFWRGNERPPSWWVSQDSLRLMTDESWKHT